MRDTIPIGLAAFGLALIPLSSAVAQQCQSYWTPAYRCMEGCGGCPVNGGNRGGSRPAGPSAAEILQRQREAASHEYNNQGLAAWNRQDWAEAARLFQLSLDNVPGDAVVIQNLANAQQKLQAVGQASHIRSLVGDYTQSLAPAPSSGGLDFDSRGGAPAPSGLDFIGSPSPSAAARTAVASGSGNTLGFGDPMVVDARNVPSGLPKSVEDEIPHTPAGDHVRKGFEAIANHDWKAAIAWFEAAHNQEPVNAGITRLVDLAQYTYGREQQTMAKTGAASRTDAEIEWADVEALMNKEMNEDMARRLEGYRSRGSASPAPTTIAPSPSWNGFMNSLFEYRHPKHRQSSIGTVRG